MKVKNVKSGDILQNGGVVKFITKSKVSSSDVYEFKESGLRLTGYHPTMYDGEWVFPHDLYSANKDLFVEKDTLAEDDKNKKEYVYDFLLERSRSDLDIAAFSVPVNGQTVILPGHGITNNKKHDILGHPYFGDWDKVNKDLSRLSIIQNNNDGLVIINSVIRNKNDNLISGLA